MHVCASDFSFPCVCVARTTIRRAWQQCRAGNKCHPTVMFKCCSLHSEKSKSVSFITCCQHVITQLSEHHIHGSDLQSTCVRTPPHPSALFIVWVEHLKLFSLFKHGMGRLSVEILTPSRWWPLAEAVLASGCEFSGCWGKALKVLFIINCVFCKGVAALNW